MAGAKKEVRIVVERDGTMKVYAEGPEGFAAKDLTEALKKTGKIVEIHKGIHPHAHGHGEHEHEHA